MALVYVGGKIAGTINGNNTTITLTGLTGGVASSPVAGDLVVAVGMIASTTATWTMNIRDPASVAYTLVGSQLNSSSTFFTSSRIAYKFMGATPDASVTITGSGRVADSGIAAVQVWRGAATTAPIPLQATASGVNSSVIVPAAVTPTVAGSAVLVYGASAAGTVQTAYTSSDLSGFQTTTANDNADASLGYGYFAWTSGTFTPATWGGGSNVAGLSWTSKTVVLVPATTPAQTGRPKFWSGTAWVQKPLKVWNGTAWVEKPVKYWNGTSWVTVT